jgi:hypothetical protein
MEELMLKRGDFVVERLTGKRAIVIHVAGDDEITCRFADGRLEDRFVFELEMPGSLASWLLAFVTSPFASRTREASQGAVGGRVRPLIVRQPSAS